MLSILLILVGLLIGITIGRALTISDMRHYIVNYKRDGEP